MVALDGLRRGDLRLLTAALGRPGCLLAVADIRDNAAVTRIPRHFQPRCVVHLAALHDIPAAVADPSLAVGTNVRGPQVMLSAALASGVERFWFASTGDVYAPSESLHREDDGGRLHRLIGWPPHNDLRRGLADLLAAEPLACGRPRADFAVNRT